MKIVTIPLLEDNYAWLLVDETRAECAVVDPSEASPVQAAIAAGGWRLRWILNTHHHWDHTGGNEGLLALHPGVEVICSAQDRERVFGATRGVSDGERLEVAAAVARCLHVPGHTLGAMAFHFEAEAALFTGDTLFGAGCGRLFEGTPAQMHASLSRLAALPPETAVYCGHEYTQKNLQFAAQLLPEDEAVRSRLDEVRIARGRGEATVPSRLAVEVATNPFLRASDPVVAAAVSAREPVEVFAAVRSRRDAF